MIRGVIAAWFLAVTACGYGDPDYGGTRFNCDVRQDNCPPGQTCLGGVCGADIGDGIRCGNDVCAIDEQCCAGGGDEPICKPRLAGCDGGQSAFCDGTEDCPGDRYCCDGVGNGEIACCEDDFLVVCQDTGDCPTAEPDCCHDDPTVPWGRCSFMCF